MVSDKIFLFKIKHKAKKFFLIDVKMTVDVKQSIRSCHYGNNIYIYIYIYNVCFNSVSPLGLFNLAGPCSLVDNRANS